MSDIKDQLVTANHILAAYNVVDGFGHVSARDPSNPDRFYISRSLAPARVTADDIRHLDLDGEPVDGTSDNLYLERYIHSEIFRARPDVQAVVHSHSPSVIPFAAVKQAPLKPIYHMSAFIGRASTHFEIADHAGDSCDMLVRSPELGKALAQTLDDAAVVLMRGHGVTVIGDTLKQAVYRGIYVEVNARAQAQALHLGDARFLTEGECVAATKSSDSQIDRAWNLWVREVQQR